MTTLTRLRSAIDNNSGKGLKMRDLVRSAEIIETVQKCFSVYRWSPQENSLLGELKGLIDDVTTESVGSVSNDPR